MRTCSYACRSADHDLSRRSFLASAALGAFALGTGTASAAGDLARAGKRVLVIFLSGGVSQLETWDPKPGTDTGGPFRAIPTSVPGTHVYQQGGLDSPLAVNYGVMVLPNLFLVAPDGTVANRSVQMANLEDELKKVPSPEGGFADVIERVKETAAEVLDRTIEVLARPAAKPIWSQM